MFETETKTESASAENQAHRFLALLERNYQRWCDDGDTEGFRKRNGMIWSAIRQAPPDVERIVQRELDRDA